MFLSVFVFSNAQDKKDGTTNKKSNQIVFANLTYGGATLKNGGFHAGISASYQYKTNLFTIGFSENMKFDTYYFVIPILTLKESVENYNILYGKRYIEDGFSYSFSGGISYMSHKKRNELGDFFSTNHYGFPIEINIRWFKNKKSVFRALYGIIPIGKPTSFGRSIGLKLFGNISKTPYIGIGLTYGFGFHKNYN